MKDIYVVIEFDDTQIFETDDLFEAYKLISQYNKSDFHKKDPCIYRKTKQGSLSIDLYGID